VNKPMINSRSVSGGEYCSSISILGTSGLQGFSHVNFCPLDPIDALESFGWTSWTESIEALLHLHLGIAWRLSFSSKPPHFQSTNLPSWRLLNIATPTIASTNRPQIIGSSVSLLKECQS
jgi:hypothetical protein